MDADMHYNEESGGRDAGQQEEAYLAEKCQPAQRNRNSGIDDSVSVSCTLAAKK